MNQFDNNNSVTFNTDKSITVILNSISTIETNKGDCTYNFDWSVLTNNTAFEVYWTCMTNIFTSTSTTPIPLVYIDLGNTNVYEAINKNTVAYKSMFLGCLCLNAIGTNSFFRNDENQNPPIFLNERPRNNTFKIQIYKNTNPPVAYSFASNTYTPIQPQIWDYGVDTSMPNYILTLKFYPIEK